MAGFSRYGVTPETLVLTDKGHERIADLESQEVRIWNGTSFEETSVFKVAEAKKILRVVTTAGVELECSEDQLFYHQPGWTPDKLVALTAAQLEPGMRLLKSPEHPVITYGTESFPHAYSHGFYVGVEKYHRRSGAASRVVIFGRRRPILDELEINQERTNNVDIWFVDDLPKMYELPLDTKYSLETRLDWLSGLADGGVSARKTKPKPIYHLYTKSWDFLVQMKLLFQTLGGDVRIAKNEDYVRDEYSLRISGRVFQGVKNLGMNPRVVQIPELQYTRRGMDCPRIVLVEDAYRTSDVYNFVGTDVGACVMNGLYVGCN